MAYVAQAHITPLDAGVSADQNQTIDNIAFLYDNLRTEMKRYHAEIPSAASGADSDEFDITTLDAAWTIYGGLSTGTIAEFEAGAVDKYDLATWPGWIAMQSDNDGPTGPVGDFGIRKAFAPGTGPWAVISRCGIWDCADLAKSQKLGFAVSDNTTPTNFTYIRLGMTSAGAWEVDFGTQGGAVDNISLGTIGYRAAQYLALVRQSAAGSTSAWVSADGIVWKRLPTTTATVTAVSYLWMGVNQDLPTAPAIRPIYLFDFIRTFPTATLRAGRGGNS